MSIESIRYFLYVRKSSESDERQVASIDSQIEESVKIATEKKLEIVETFKEEKSALKPGRPIFNKMIEDIKKGRANGILCWKLNRLARNLADGGNIIHMLQTSVIQQIYTFTKVHLPTDDVLPIAIEFGMANQYSRDLSVDTLRGQRKQIKDGWMPHKPPPGYLNNKYKSPNLDPIYMDPLSFPIMKKLWDILLKERCTIDKLYRISQDMGLKNSKGGKISITNFYRLFRNPFYYGSFPWNDEIHPGLHQPMISRTEFDLAQIIIDMHNNPKSKKHIFAFTGLIHCAECGAFITADVKTKHQKNGNVHHYTYYRCTRKIKRDCSEPAVRSDELEKQITDILGKISIPIQFQKWAIKQLKEEQNKEIGDRKNITNTFRNHLDNCNKKLDTLFNMRLNLELTPEEYSKQKKILAQEKHKYESLLADTQVHSEDWLKRAEDTLSFAQSAKQRFENGSLEEKHYILSCLGNNLILSNRTLQIQFNKSLALFQEVATEVQSLHNRLEPAKGADFISDCNTLYAQSKKWSG
jgi:site-specific DNA recombinase